MRKDNTSGYVGVSFHKPTGKYQARVTIGRENHYYLGVFDNPRAAAFAVDQFKRSIGRRAPNGIPPGEFCRETECLRNCADGSRRP